MIIQYNLKISKTNFPKAYRALLFGKEEAHMPRNAVFCFVFLYSGKFALPDIYRQFPNC